MKCSMILAAAAVAAPMTMADEAVACGISYAAATAAGAAEVNDPKTTCPKTCPVTLQTAIDKVYADCGCIESGGVEWDTTVGPLVKADAALCACSGAAHAAPVFALAAAAMAFFA